MPVLESSLELFSKEFHAFKNNECFDENGKIKPIYEFIFNSFSKMGVSGIEARVAEIKRLLRETGILLNPSADGYDWDRPLNLDPLPVLFSSEEWMKLERLLMQRAELYDLILQDIYGEANLIRRKLIPPEIIFGHPNFLRPIFNNFPIIKKRHLVLQTVDLVRDRDQGFMVISNHTQKLNGLGFSLENRIVLSRVFPSIYRDSQVHRVAIFFRALRQLLDADRYRTVFWGLTTESPEYLENAYLANYLGFPLVQAEDLLVKNGQLYLKTVEGQIKIERLLRKLEDHYCDNLEIPSLKPSVPGLLQSVRLNQLVVVPQIGVGVLENPALEVFLPQLAKALLGEDLKLSSCQTYWCGEAKSLHHVISHIDKMVIKPIYQRRVYFGSLLSLKQKEELINKIKKQSYFYVGQEVATPSLVPVWDGGAFRSGYFYLRTFLVAQGTSYLVYPGGLGKVQYSQEKPPKLAKDIWIIASEPQREISLLSQSKEKLVVNRSAGIIPSRAADNLFWLGRYIERTDMLCRLLRLAFDYLSEGKESQREVRYILLSLLTQVTTTWPGFFGQNREELLQNPQSELKRLIYDREVAGSLAFNIRSLSYAKRAIQDRFSFDMNRILSQIALLENDPGDLSDFIYEQLDQIIFSIAAFHGLVHENMQKTASWRFLELGQRIERAQQILRLLIGFFWQDGSLDSQNYEILLKITDSYMSYQRRYFFQVEALAVLDLLLFDEGNPRSLIYQLKAIERELGNLPKEKETLMNHQEKKFVLLAIAKLYLWEQDKFALDRGAISHLREVLEEILELCNQIADEISKDYFRYQEQQKQLFFLEES